MLDDFAMRIGYTCLVLGGLLLCCWIAAAVLFVIDWMREKSEKHNAKVSDSRE